MCAKVFISCGQREDENDTYEVDVAGAVDELLRVKLKYQTYLACRIQTLTGLDEAIRRGLETSDYFLFIDFCRENLEVTGDDKRLCRGSLFSHQELALAYYLGFGDNLIYLQDQYKNMIDREGLLTVLQVKPIPFGTGGQRANKEEVVEIVEREVNARWDKRYSRLLVPSLEPRPTDPFLYRDHRTQKIPDDWRIRVRGIEVHNGRRDRAALGVTLTMTNLYRNMDEVTCPDTTPLKVGGHYCTYQANIPPRRFRTFDTLVFFPNLPGRVYLNSLNDIAVPCKELGGTPFKTPVCDEPGLYHMKFRIDSFDFPGREFYLELQLKSNVEETQARIVADGELPELGRQLRHRSGRG
jgi:hypothetical protein